ncbi:hypothetical protein [Niastella sp. OAS944]|uniref:hypothetical protein n=1 Tax=Niastella sp. OAS944 TaxID=2664089 RepID=UPI00346D42A3|nr:hypothetical protein [Chitinophagaceae bacterium OAS944]
MLQGNTSKEKAARDRKLEPEKNAGENQTDTAPDEFIAPNADTDVPLDNEGIVNDAVLRGEDHENDKAENKQKTGKQ